jgi:mRNA interferase MazF
VQPGEQAGYVFMAPVTGTQRGWPFEVPISEGWRVSGVVLADQTKSIDFATRFVRYLAPSPDGLGEAVL